MHTRFFITLIYDKDGIARGIFKLDFFEIYRIPPL